MNRLDLFRSQVVVTQDYPDDRIDRRQSLLVFDEAVQALNDSKLNQFIESFPYRVAFKAGESLKDFKQFPKNLDQVLKAWPQPISRGQSLVALGGGSLGDFAGFVASIVKRGVKLIQVPSTWLAAMDSAHGGKNGLNYDTVKNQLGTFYPAESVFIVRDLLNANPSELRDQSYGELIKMGLVGDSKFFKDLMMEKREANEFIWRFLTKCIEDKYTVILQDPYETKSIRQVLNFGHTFGHALEAQFSWPHGDAVLQGIFFALEWSRKRAELSQPLFDQIHETIASKFDRVVATELKWYRPPNAKTMMKWLQADKKINDKGEILFVFLRNIGKPVLQQVTVEELLEEAKRQNWVK